MKEYCIILTYQCNWNCPYCIVDTHNQKEVSFKDIIKKVESVEYNSEVNLSGGEPGLLSTDNLLYIIEKLKFKNCIIRVITNGEFFKNHPSLLHLVDKYYYHASDDLNINDEVYINSDLEIAHVLVIHDNNIQNLNNFLNKNKDIKFKLIGADDSNKPGAPTLNKMNAIKIINEHSDIIENSFLTLLQKIPQCQVM